MADDGQQNPAGFDPQEWLRNLMEWGQGAGQSLLLSQVPFAGPASKIIPWANNRLFPNDTPVEIGQSNADWNARNQLAYLMDFFNRSFASNEPEFPGFDAPRGLPTSGGSASMPNNLFTPEQLEQLRQFGDIGPFAAGGQGQGGQGTGQGGLQLPNVAGLGEIFPGGLGSFGLPDPYAAVEAALQRLGIGQGGGGGGGGGRRGPLFDPSQLQGFLDQAGTTGTAGAANAFLGGSFSDPSSLIAQLDPQTLALMAGVRGEQGGLLERFLGLVQGGGNPLLQELMSGGGGGGGGGAYGTPLRAPDIRLRDLDENTLRSLAAGRASELGSARLAGADRQDQLLSRLYGRGVERSTVALDEAGRLSYGEDQIVNQIMANHEARILQLKETDAERRARLAQTELQANAQVQSAGLSAGGQAAAARFGALGNVLGSQLNAITRLFSDQTGFNQAALGSYGDLGQTLTSANAGVLQQLLSTAGGISTAREGNTADLLQQMMSSDAAIRAAQIGASASRYNSGLDFALGSGQLGAGQNQDLMQFILGLGNLANQRYGLNLEQSRDAFNQEGPSNLDRFIALAPLFLRGAQTFGWFGAQSPGGGG